MTDRACTRYRALPRTSSIGAAASATRSANRRLVASGRLPRDSHRPSSASAWARKSSAARARRGVGPADPMPVPTRLPVRVQGQAERGHRDDHRVAGADLAELLWPGGRGDQYRLDQLVRLQRVAFHPGVELVGRDQPGAAHRLHLHLGAGGQQRGMRVARRGRGPEVAADRAPVADLRGPDGAGRHGQPGQPVTQLGLDPRVGHPGAEPDAPVVRGPLGQLTHPGQVEEVLRPVPVEVQLDHDVGAALDRHRVRVRRLQLQGFRPRLRLQELHGTSPLPRSPTSQAGTHGLVRGRSAGAGGLVSVAHRAGKPNRGVRPPTGAAPAPARNDDQRAPRQGGWLSRPPIRCRGRGPGGDGPACPARADQDLTGRVAWMAPPVPLDGWGRHGRPADRGEEREMPVEPAAAQYPADLRWNSGQAQEPTEQPWPGGGCRPARRGHWRRRSSPWTGQ